MSSSLLPTKLFLPPLRRSLVSRGRLMRRLGAGLYAENEGFGRKLTLVSAPAGYGKTTLVAQWLHGESAPAVVAWISLDEGDADPARFFEYLVVALKTTGVKLSEQVSTLLKSPQQPTPESLIGAVINGLGSSGQMPVLVLEDYHLISSPDIHRSLSFLLAHQPSQLHLVIITREDPPFSLNLLRGRGEMVEIRRDDLRFTLQETTLFLNEVMDLDLTSDEIASLHGRTEGWISGLQLAAVALQGSRLRQSREDTGRFVRSFTGSNRFVLDYLIEEVFRQQPPDIQKFLLQTAILDRLSGPLCGAITGRQDSQELLRRLEEANLFIVPFGESRQWYRYHKLFSDLLRFRLQQEGFETGQLHRQASQWYEVNGFMPEAIDHAFAASDWGRAAELVSGCSNDLLKQGQIVTLLRWVQALPEEIIGSEEELCLNAAWALALAGRHKMAEYYLALFDQPSHKSPALLGSVLALKAYIARANHDIEEAVDLSHKALVALPADDSHTRSVLRANLAVAYLYKGDLAMATDTWNTAARDGLRSGNHHASVLALSFLGQVRAAQGKLHQAADLQRRAIQLGVQNDASPTTARARVNLSALLYEWNELEKADIALRRALELGTLVGDKHVQRDGLRILARILQAKGDNVGALGAIRKAHELFAEGEASIGAYLSNAMTHLRVALALQDLAMAWRWWERIEQLATETTNYRPDLLANAGLYSPHLGLARARLLLAQGEKGRAADLLSECYRVAVKEGLRYCQVRARLLQSLVAPTHEAAANILADALTMAQPEGYVRSFVDEGRSMAALLSSVGHLQSRYGAFGKRMAGALGEIVSAQTEGNASSTTQAFGPANAEQLSERELETLQLLAQHQTNAEIAQALIVSPNTVKTHLRHIYEKLGVHDRRAAVARARELNLIS